MPIPVIDIFAGPGGLGEGFSSLRRNGDPVFKIKLSIEKNRIAHQTLKLRAFYRQFSHREAPPEYYDRLAGLISSEELYQRYPNQAQDAAAEALCAELGGRDFPDSKIDEHIDKARGTEPDWVLIGGPPCQAYSLVGRARRVNDPGFAADEKHTLYKQYLRILAVHRPPVFVMENVKGILSARHNDAGILGKILADLQNPLDAVYGPARNRQNAPLEYRLYSLVTSRRNADGTVNPEDFVVCAEDYGIPQARHRVIILGVLAERNATPRLLKQQAPVQVQDVLSDLPRLRSGLSREPDKAVTWYEILRDIPTSGWFRSDAIDEPLRREMSGLLVELNGALERGGEAVPPSRRVIRCYARWYVDPKLNVICNHITRLHIREDLHRYFFVSAFARAKGCSPTLKDFPTELLPLHKNVRDAIDKGTFQDRFNAQVAGLPATTITSHIAKDGHYFIHYDPTQCRSLTVREAARIQTFPDNYFFEGPRTDHYKQVGNAVPPLLARKIAKIVANLFA